MVTVVLFHRKASRLEANDFKERANCIRSQMNSLTNTLYPGVTEGTKVARRFWLAL